MSIFIKLSVSAQRVGLMLACCTLALASGIACAASEELKLQEINKGEKPGRRFAASLILNAPIEKVCNTIQDYASYPSFMPNIANTVVKRLDASAALVDFTFNLPLGMVKQYRLKMSSLRNAQSCNIAWKLQPWPELKPEQTILDTDGFWHLTTLPGNPGKTQIKYETYTDPGAVPIGMGWIVNGLSRDGIGNMMEALRKRVAAS